MSSLHGWCLWEKIQRMGPVDSLLSTTASTPHPAPACSSPCLLPLLLLDVCMPTGVLRVGWGGAFLLHCGFLVASPSPAGLLAFISYKVWVHPLRGNFCFWTTEFSICSGKISCEEEEANKWSSRMPCSHSAWCRGLGGSQALCFHPLVGSHCFSGGQFTCLPASRLALRLACSRCVNMHVC